MDPLSRHEISVHFWTGISILCGWLYAPKKPAFLVGVGLWIRVSSLWFNLGWPKPVCASVSCTWPSSLGPIGWMDRGWAAWSVATPNCSVASRQAWGLLAEVQLLRAVAVPKKTWLVLKFLPSLMDSGSCIVTSTCCVHMHTHFNRKLKSIHTHAYIPL